MNINKRMKYYLTIIIIFCFSFLHAQINDDNFSKDDIKIDSKKNINLIVESHLVEPTLLALSFKFNSVNEQPKYFGINDKGNFSITNKPDNSFSKILLYQFGSIDMISKIKKKFPSNHIINATNIKDGIIEFVLFSPFSEIAKEDKAQKKVQLLCFVDDKSDDNKKFEKIIKNGNNKNRLLLYLVQEDKIKTLLENKPTLENFKYYKIDLEANSFSATLGDSKKTTPNNTSNGVNSAAPNENSSKEIVLDCKYQIKIESTEDISKSKYKNLKPVFVSFIEQFLNKSNEDKSLDDDDNIFEDGKFTAKAENNKLINPDFRPKKGLKELTELKEEFKIKDIDYTPNPQSKIINIKVTFKNEFELKLFKPTIGCFDPEIQGYTFNIMYNNNLIEGIEFQRDKTNINKIDIKASEGVYLILDNLVLHPYTINYFSDNIYKDFRLYERSEESEITTISKSYLKNNHKPQLFLKDRNIGWENSRDKLNSYNTNDLTGAAIISKENADTNKNTNSTDAKSIVSNNSQRTIEIAINQTLKEKYTFNFPVLKKFIDDNLTSIYINNKEYKIRDNSISLNEEVELSKAKLKSNNSLIEISYDNNKFIVSIKEESFPIEKHSFSILSKGNYGVKIIELDGITLYYNNVKIELDKNLLQSDVDSVFKIPLICSKEINYNFAFYKKGHKKDEFSPGDNEHEIIKDFIKISSEDIKISKVQDLGRLYLLIPKRFKEQKDKLAVFYFKCVNEEGIKVKVPGTKQIFVPSNKIKNNSYTFSPSDLIENFDEFWKIDDENKSKLIFNFSERESVQKEIDIIRKVSKKENKIIIDGELPSDISLEYNISVLGVKKEGITIPNKKLKKGFSFKYFLPDTLMEGEEARLSIKKPYEYNIELNSNASDWKKSEIVINDLTKTDSINLKFIPIAPFELFYLDLSDISNLDSVIQLLSQKIGDRKEGFAIYISSGSKPLKLKNEPQKLNRLYTIMKGMDFDVPDANKDTSEIRNFFNEINFIEEFRTINLHLVLSRTFYRNFQFEKREGNELYTESFAGGSVFEFDNNKFIRMCLHVLPKNKLKELNLYFGTDKYVTEMNSKKKKIGPKLFEFQDKLKIRNIKINKL